jgi:hypothetical protein
MANTETKLTIQMAQDYAQAFSVSENKMPNVGRTKNSSHLQ